MKSGLVHRKYEPQQLRSRLGDEAQLRLFIGNWTHLQQLPKQISMRNVTTEPLQNPVEMNALCIVTWTESTEYSQKLVESLKQRYTDSQF